MVVVCTMAPFSCRLRRCRNDRELDPLVDESWKAMKLSCRLMADPRVGSEREQPHSQSPAPRVGRTEHDAHVGFDCNELATTFGSPLGSCRHAALPELPTPTAPSWSAASSHRVDERCVYCLHVSPGCRRERRLRKEEFIDVPRNVSHRSCRRDIDDVSGASSWARRPSGVSCGAWQAKCSQT